jgi:hypothetical protein
MAIELLRKPAAPGVTGESSFEDIESVVAAEATLTATSVATSVVNSLVPNTPRVQNLIINGSMDYWQRATSINPISGAYAADRWYVQNAVSFLTMRCDKIADSPNTITSSCAEMRVVTPAAATNTIRFIQGIEGNFYYPLHNGQTVTLSFWVKSNKPGLHSVTFSNGDNTRSRIDTYTISASDTWERKTITLTTDTSGSWNWGAAAGFRVIFNVCPYGGASPTGTWSGSLLNNASGLVTDFPEAANNYIRIAQVMLIKGSGVVDFQRAGDTAAGELALCQRYYEKSYAPDTLPGAANTHSRYATLYGYSTAAARGVLPFLVPKRAAPVATLYAYAGTANKLTLPATSALTTAGTGTVSAGTVDVTGHVVATDSSSGLSATGVYWAAWTADCDIF